MLIRRPSDIPSSEITPESIYLRRREFMAQTAATVAAGFLSPLVSADDVEMSRLKPLDYRKAVSADTVSGANTNEALTPYRDVTHYNNFYEFGTDKRRSG